MTYLRHEDGGFDTRKTGAEEEVMREVLLFFCTCMITRL